MHIFLWSSALFLLNSWPLWAVEASDDPFPLFSLSAVSHTTTGNERPHQSTISSTHLLGGLPLCRSPSTMPGMVVFVSFLSGIWHIWPTNYSFLCFIMSTTVKFLCTAHTIVHYYNCTRYCSTQTVLLIFTFLQTDITSQMRPSGGIIIIIIIISTFINSARVTQCHNGAGWRQRLSSAHQICL